MLANFQSYADSNLTAQSSGKTLSLPEVWARKYVENLHRQDQALAELDQSQSKGDVAQKLMDVLRSISANAWNKTEKLIGHEIRRHQIDRDLIDPWMIAKDVHQVYESALMPTPTTSLLSGFQLRPPKSWGLSVKPIPPLTPG